MKTERSNINYPLWRKKVDSSMWGHNVTTIPNWACKMWDIDSLFRGVTSKKDEDSEITIKLGKKKWNGWVTVASKGRKTPAYRLWFDEDLTQELKQVFLMSYMRDIEDNIRGKYPTKIEDDIPFWEFLDIEFDSLNKQFIFVPYYTQKPTFPNLFNSIVSSPKLKEIDSLLSAKNFPKIYKQDWRNINDYHTEIGADNVIYMLINKTNKEFYVGEAKNLIQRFSSGNYAKKWEFYRYDKLPKELESFRLEIERALIKCFSTLLNNNKNIDTMHISSYTLTNSKIDK